MIGQGDFNLTVYFGIKMWLAIMNSLRLKDCQEKA